eukprot:CAMPEP_0181055218 /NCGR_PEP_ID=MMETSP1070-20121207/19088_1 /TAXON_ID=265543 /ORGANISM="Minutocellus polymorphus, Strain NH13" /LENGTH=96 /DNA_ID=CAMNT_0023134527 /DNA_START=151 /DNA_END=441 /DNA_ORIENTATION=-
MGRSAIHESIDVVLLGEGDLEAFGTANVGSQAGQTLLATAADADEQSTATGCFNQANDARQMLEGILEQHQLHLAGGKFLVVLARSRMSSSDPPSS